MHFRCLNYLLVLLTIRSESHSTVEENFQVGPYFFQSLFSCLFKNTFDKYQHPRRYAGQACHIYRNSAVGDCFYFGFPFAHQCNFLAGYTNEIDKRIHILNQNSG